MLKRLLDRTSLAEFEDWYGNNAAVRCPACRKVFVVSGFINNGSRSCPRCEQSTASITLEEASIEWIETAAPLVLTRAQLETSQKLQQFVTLVSAGGAVGERSITNRLPKAEKVALVEIEGAIAAAAARKRASRDNAAALSARSGFTLQAHIPEIGYVVVDPKHAGQRLSSKVFRRILLEFEGEPVFATTSDSKIKHLLARSEFDWVGHEWESQMRPGERLSLWVRGVT